MRELGRRNRRAEALAETDLPADEARKWHRDLRDARDVSAVIETPGGFLLYVAKEKTDTALSVACLSLAKRSYEQWLSAQTEEAK